MSVSPLWKESKVEPDQVSAETTGAGQAAGHLPVSSRFAVRLAWSIAGVAAVFEVLSLVLLILNSLNPNVDTYAYWGASIVTALVFPVIGALIVSRYPGNALGWVFCVMGLAGGIGDSSSEYATYALLNVPSALPE